MKTATPLLCTLLLFCGALARADDVAPPLPIAQAAAIAQQALVDKGAETKVFIQSIALFRGSVLTKSRWEVSWSSPIEGSRPHSLEVGVEISMNGDVVHLLRGHGEVRRVPTPH